MKKERSAIESNCHRNMKWDEYRKCFIGSGNIEGSVDISESRFSEVVKPETRFIGMMNEWNVKKWKQHL